jgi:O-antigen ligase
MHIKYQRNIGYLLLLFLAAALVLLKVWRGLLYQTEQQGGIWNVIQVFLVGTGVLCIFSKSKTFMSLHCIKTYLFFFLYIWFLSLFPFLGSDFDIPHIFRFLVIPYGVMSLLTFYTIGYKANIRQYPWVLGITFLVLFYWMFTKWRAYNLSIIDSNGAVADVYYLVGLLPIVLLYTPQKFKIVPFLLAFIVVVMSSKRGALVAVVLMLVVYFFFAGSQRNGKKTNIVLRILVFSFALILVYYVVVRMVGQYDLNIFYRMEKLGDDGGSGRTERWGAILNAFSIDSNILQMLFGHGDGSVTRLVGGHAHNDFLEFLYDYGLFAFVLYVAFYVFLIKEVLRMYKRKYVYAREFACSVIVALCMSMFSFYAVDCTHITSSSICQGLILADWYKFKTNEYSQQQDE